MTVREEAYELINNLPEDSVRAVIQIMVRMVPSKKRAQSTQQNITPKKKAFLELQEMRKEAAKYDFSLDERASAMEEKYGTLHWNGGVQ